MSKRFHLITFLIWISFGLILPQSVNAGQDELALFFDELVPYGNWVEYKQYGPVWYPTKEVAASWRPYLNGRWVPSAKGWVFETAEPWGWATYHFGNWMATQEYGWVWVPGSTWYASTATWRKSKRAIGWAPVPPPNYEPEPAFVPVGGFPADTPAQEQLIPAMYVFAEGPAFIQGTDQPYDQEYSYINSGGVVAQDQVEEMFPTTELVSNFVSQVLNPEAVANWGPPLDEVSEVTGANPMALMNTVNATDVMMVQNGWPPPMVLDRRAYFAPLLPPPAYAVRPVMFPDNRMPYGMNMPGQVKLPPDKLPHAPQNWPQRNSASMRPRQFTSASLTPGQPPRFLSLPATATGGMQKQGGHLAAPGGRDPISPRGATAAAGSKGPLPAATDRRANLAQERSKMEDQRRQLQQTRTGGGSEGALPGKLSPGGGTVGKPGSSGEPARTPVAHSQSTSGGPGTPKVASTPQTRPSPGSGSQSATASKGSPQPSNQSPPTAEHLGQQRQAQEQARIQQLQQKQQAGGLAPGGQSAGSPSLRGPQSGGTGMGSPSSSAPGGSVRPPRTSGGSAAGGPANAAPGGGAVRAPRSGGGGGGAPAAGQPAMAGRQGGAAQAPKAQAQPPASPKGGGGGGGGKPAPPKKQEEKKPK
jgi:hypothetical protein